MRKTALSLAIAAFLFASTFDLHSGTLNGVTLPDTIQARGTPLVLNGMGLRTKYGMKIYVAGLYLQQKSSDPDAIIKSDAPKRIVMQFLHGASKSQMADAFSESFRDNAPDAEAALKSDVDRFLGQLDAVHSGDQMVFTYIPGHGHDLRSQWRRETDRPRSGLRSTALLRLARTEASQSGIEKRTARAIEAGPKSCLYISASCETCFSPTSRLCSIRST